MVKYFDMKKEKSLVMCSNCALAKIFNYGNNEPLISECSLHGRNVAEINRICSDFKNRS